MASLPLLVVAAVLATFGWGWFSNWFTPKPLDNSRMDGIVSVDAEFDPELNAMIREVDALEKDGGLELNEIEKLP